MLEGTYGEGRQRGGGGGLGRWFILSTCGASKEGGGEDGRSHSFVKPHSEGELKARGDRAENLAIKKSTKERKLV